MKHPRDIYIKSYVSSHQQKCDQMRREADEILRKHDRDYWLFAAILLVPVLLGWLLLASLGI